MTENDPGFYRNLINRILLEDENSADAPVSQQELQAMVKRGTVLKFIKNTPVALIPYSMLRSYVTPEQEAKINQMIGSVDQTSYGDEHKKSGYLVFQWDSKNNSPDLYVADGNSVKTKYAKFSGNLPTDEKVRSKIPSLVALDHLKINPTKIPFFVKKIPVNMVSAKELGLEGKTIQTSWGTQSVANGGFIVIEDNGHCYTVAPDVKGLPIGYIQA